MKQESGLFRKNLASIKKSVWYRQRFDACPHFMFFLGDAHVSNIQNTKYPFGQEIAYAGFSKNRADWYHSLSELEKTAGLIIKVAKKDSKVSLKMIKEFKKWETAFYKKCLSLNEINLNKLSKRQLVAKYKELEHIYVNKLNSSPLIDGFALSADTLIASKIKSFLEQKGLIDKFTTYFNILTAPTSLSFLQQEEIVFIFAAKKIAKNPEKKKEILGKHVSNFFWIQNNYVSDNILSFNHFEKRLKEYINISHDEEINKLKRLPRENRTRKIKLIKQLRLPKELKVLLQITDDFNYWQDERKKGTFWATHYFNLFLHEITKRTNYSLEELKYALPPEIEDVVNERIPRRILKERFAYCMIIFNHEQYDVITNRKLIKELDLIGTGKSQATRELRGFAASLGKVSGTAKIIESVDEIKKVKLNDVIIAVMTRPDYLPAMKKASAFVTDEGGITSHAAIVSREMKKPCIVGTKIATKIFKDGDLVEVNANHGWVRKIK